MIKNVSQFFQSHQLNLLKGQATTSTTSKSFPFEKGEVVKGKVLEGGTLQNPKLFIKGQELTAKTSVELKPGQVAYFRVDQTSPEYVLKLLESPTNNAQNIQKTLGNMLMKSSPYNILADLLAPLLNSKGSEKSKLSEQLQKIWELLSKLSFKPDDIIDPLLVRSFLYRSGLVWENKIKSLLNSKREISKEDIDKIAQDDIKGLSLLLLEEPENENEQLKQVLKQFVENIENFQKLNQTSLEHEGTIFLMLPLQFADSTTNAQLLIDTGTPEQKKNQESQPCRVTLLLDMSKLGPLKIQAVLFQKIVNIDVWVTSSKAEKLINASSEEFKKDFERDMIYVSSFACHIVDKSDLENITIANEYVNPNERLNIVI